MKSVAQLVSEFYEKGIRLWAEEGRLRYKAPRGKLTRALRAELVERKAELVAFLSQATVTRAEPAVVTKAESRFPLSYGQQALWFLYLEAPESGAYNMVLPLHIQSELNLSALRRALQSLVNRHPALRTTFSMTEGNPVQEIHDSHELAFDMVDATAWTWDELMLNVKKTSQSPFNLESGPVFRASLFTFAPQEHVLLLTLHHIAGDAFSFGIMLDELLVLYEAEIHAQPSALPPLPTTYADYVRWERERLAGAEGERLAAYWQQQLAGEIPLLNLPTDRPRPSVQTYNGASYMFRLTPELTQQLKMLAQRTQTTLFVTLLATFQLLLHRVTGQEEIWVGSPTGSGRSRSEFAQIVGYLVNPVVLRARFPQEPTLSSRSFLSQVRQTVLAAIEHQAYPFPLLVKQLQPARDASYSPLFQVMFNLEGSGSQKANDNHLAFSLLEMGQMEGQFDLALIVTDSNPLLISIRYNADLFEAATIERMAGHFQTLLMAIVTNPEQPINQYTLLTEAERQQVLFEWNDTATDYASEKCIHQLFSEQVERTPDAIAVVFEGEQLTYHELNQRSNQLAHHLLSLDVGPEVLVGICVERSLEMMVGLLGILKAGGAYVPLDPSYPKERLAFMLEDADVNLLLTQEKLLANLPEGPTTLCLDTLYMQLTQNTNIQNGFFAAENLAYVMYTSGSTGRPKGVSVIHRNVVRLVKETNFIQFSQEDVFLQFAPISFDAATLEIWGALLNGGKLVVMPPYNPSLQELGKAIERHQITTLWLTAGLFHLMVDEQLEDLHSLRWLLAGGDVLSVSHVRKAVKALPHCQLINGYGPTENTTFTCCFSVQEVAPTDVSIPIGRPIANTQVYILDRHLQPVPIGVFGELYAGGDGLARGYHNNAILTEERFISNPFGAGRLYRTGDIARWLPDGNIEFLGRMDHQVKLRGFRLELGEIEAVLGQHPQVQEAIVVPRTSGNRPRRLVAYVVPKGPSGKGTEGQGETATLQAVTLRDYLKHKLPDYMIPSAFVALDALPLTPNGKIDRRALPAPREAYRIDSAQLLLPRTPVETSLAAIWQDVLGLKQVGVTDNFFQIGGDSILSIQIVSRAKEAGIELTPKELFQHQTIAELASMAGSVQKTHAEQGVVTGSLPLTPIQHWFFNRQLEDPHHFNQAVLLKVRPKVKAERLAQALQQILIHHDALRLRFSQNADSGWQQRYAPPSDLIEDLPFSVIDLSTHSPQERQSVLERTASEMQASLNLSDGPLMRMALFDFGPHQPGRLLWIIHHLAVDAVSWRILLEDLTTAYLKLERGEAIQLPSKTTSYKAWSNWQSTYAQSEELSRELAWWLAKPSQLAPLPVDFPAGREHNTVASAAAVSCSLSVEETEALLREAPAAYHTQVNDLLLTALVLAFAQWTGSDSLLLDLEGHGREELVEEIDLSRTVGWLTAIFPVHLQLESASGLDQMDQSNLGHVIKSVKEQLRQIPNRGIGYGILRYLKAEPELAHRAEIVFNYFGQFTDSATQSADDQTADSLILGTEPESIGPFYSPRQTRSHLIEINGAVSGNQLQVDWTYSQQIHQAATIQRLANRFVAALRTLIRHCQSPEAGGYTPSDFPEAPLSQAELDQVLAEIASTNGVPKIEALYPLSPSQQGMLLESLSAQGSGIHIEQALLRLDGTLDLSALERTWQQIIQRHPILRTGFIWVGLSEPLQFVLSQITVTIEQHDWQHLSMAEQETQIETYLQRDRTCGFDLTQAPLIRLTLFQTGTQSHQLLWTFHHILMDGWSAPLVLNEVQEFYTAESTRQALHLSPTRPYREYIAWLQRQDKTQASAFWRARLQGFTQPTPLRMKLDGEANKTPEKAYGEEEALLSAAATERLEAWTRRHQLLLNTSVQGAWALLLSRYSGQSDVLFGATVSGRPPEIAGIEFMVGLFINTLPIRVQVDALAAPHAWLERIQAQNFARQPYSYCGTAEVHRWSDLPDGFPLYESLLVFQNYPVDPSSSPAPEAQSLAITYADGVGAQTNYALTLMAVPDRESNQLGFRAVYDHSAFESAHVRQILAHLLTLLEQLPQQDTVKALLESIHEAQVHSVQQYQPQSLRETFVAPRDLLEVQLAQIWAEMLGCPVGVTDNFFDLGGHSLLVITLREDIQRHFAVTLPLVALFEHPTIEQLATLIDRQQERGAVGMPPSSLVAIQPHGQKRPFFCVPGSSGFASYFGELARHLGASQPFYGFQARGLDGESEPHSSIEEMAAHYIENLQRVQAQGPYLLGGHSFGAFVAFEMAQQLIKAGEEVPRLVIFDTVPHKQQLGDLDISQTNVLFELAYQEEIFSDKKLNVSYQHLLSLSPDEQFDYVLDILKEANLLPPRADIKLLRGITKVIQNSGEITYTPQDVVSVPVTLLRARDEQRLWTDIEEPALGWREFMGDAVELYFVPGDHNSMMKAPHVQTLAKKVSASLAD